MHTKIIVLKVTVPTWHSSRQSAKVTQGYSEAVTDILLNPCHLGQDYFTLMSAFWNSPVSILRAGISNGARTVYAYFFYLEEVQTSCSVYITHIYSSLPHGGKYAQQGKHASLSSWDVVSLEIAGWHQHSLLPNSVRIGAHQVVFLSM